MLDEEENHVISDRIINKLMQEIEISDGSYLYVYTLCLKNAPNSEKLSVLDAINSIISIETIQSLKEQINLLAPNNKEQLELIKGLKRELADYLIDTLINYSTAEIITVYNDADDNTNVEQIPQTSIKLLKLLIFANFKNLFEDIIQTCTKETINLLATNNPTYDSPKSIFEYMKFITRLDILLSYTDSGLYKEIEKYINGTQFNNDNIKEEVKNILKKHKGRSFGKTKPDTPKKD